MTIIVFIFLIIFVYFIYSMTRIKFFPSIKSAKTRMNNNPEADNLYKHVHEIATGIGSRSVYEYAKIRETECYITSVLEQFEMNYVTQEFFYQNNPYHNIIATIPGHREADNIFIVGAHYDTVLGTPGADDNASGVAVLLEMCRLLGHCEPDKTIKLIFFVLEEPPVFETPSMGSFIYAKQARQNNEKICGMISLEMVGFYHNKKGAQTFPLPLMNLFYSSVPDFIAVVGNLFSRRLVKRIRDSIKKNSSIAVESISTFSFIPGINWSDHGSFWKMGYPAVMVTDTSFYRNPHYHGGSDTTDTLDYIKMSELLKGLFQAVVDMAGIGIQDY